MNQASSEGANHYAPPENFEILVLWIAISSVLRGQILSKMFSKSVHISWALCELTLDICFQNYNEIKAY